MQLGVRSYYSVDRAPVKFHRIRSSFDSPTIIHSGTVAGLFVGRFGLRNHCRAAFLLSLLSAQASLSHSPLAHLSNPLRSGPLDRDPMSENGAETPQTLAILLYMDPPCPFWAA